MLKKNAKEKKSKTRVISSIGNLNNMNKKLKNATTIKKLKKKWQQKKIIKRTRPKPIRRIKQSNVEGQNWKKIILKKQTKKPVKPG